MAGFKVNPNSQIVENLSGVKDFCNAWENKRHKLPYATDGVVVKINDFKAFSRTHFAHQRKTLLIWKRTNLSKA